MSFLFVFCQSAVSAAPSFEELWFCKYKIELQNETGQKAWAVSGVSAFAFA